ncbi:MULTISPECIES: DUF1145 domain-containing protein [unclassified Shewanella]|mgnify:CR=1 FL=1|jgi:uncharacterized protein YhhL (DUF1145 family)|uniref:DUF1145 domain-containing protein n=1 Tax=unclassified Shewanella TaxID=196818 RepID=UPI000C34B94D|nr:MULTISPECIES: DUF1145 domain-containing protein [unclassified Shewanella]MBO1897192.1 DUF1145 domain-containing protein [Shewanella sp. BF02_Schw]PKH34365.1 hypothetical protein CXF88_00795 [Shewanella sp. ALD9]QHS11873.1 DUF1145 domain-containing protein [Shewanella sp. Arc9-LZ]
MPISIHDIILIGKTATLSMWCLVAYGLFIFSPDVSLFINTFAFITAAMHMLFVLLTRLKNFRNSIPAAHYRAILLWGVFALFEQHHSQYASPLVNRSNK